MTLKTLNEFLMVFSDFSIGVYWTLMFVLMGFLMVFSAFVLGC